MSSFLTQDLALDLELAHTGLESTLSIVGTALSFAFPVLNFESGMVSGRYGRPCQVWHSLVCFMKNPLIFEANTPFTNIIDR